MNKAIEEAIARQPCFDCKQPVGSRYKVHGALYCPACYQKKYGGTFRIDWQREEPTDDR